MVLKFENGTSMQIASPAEAHSVVDEDLAWIEAVHGRLTDIQYSSSSGSSFEVSIPACDEGFEISTAESIMPDNRGKLRDRCPQLCLCS